MEPKLFLERLRLCHSGKVSELAYFGLTWNQWAKFAKMTRDLDYGCDFNSGRETCSGKKAHYYGATAKEKCCCGGCRSHSGYLTLIPNNEEIIKEIVSLYDKEHGFWRKKKGCILPIEYRSATCIAYRCNEARKKRNGMLESCGFGVEALEQMILYFLETTRSDKLSATQIRTIIKELIKTSTNNL